MITTRSAKNELVVTISPVESSIVRSFRSKIKLWPTHPGRTAGGRAAGVMGFACADSAMRGAFYTLSRRITARASRLARTNTVLWRVALFGSVLTKRAWPSQQSSTL